MTQGVTLEVIGFQVSNKAHEPCSYPQVQVADMEDTVDNLNQDFAQLTRQSLHVSNNLRELEQELLAQTDLLRRSAEGSADHAQHKNSVRETTNKMTAAKASLESLALQKSNCLDRLNLFKKRLEEKQAQLEQHMRKPESERKQQAERKLQTAMGKTPKKKTRK